MIAKVDDLFGSIDLAELRKQEVVEKQNDITTEFDEELFGIIVERIIVRDKNLEFMLISGLSFKENI